MVVSDENKGLADGIANACTTACTRSPDSGHDDAGDTADGDFAEALAMVARLPLSDAERAEAVRRLLAQTKGDKQ